MWAEVNGPKCGNVVNNDEIGVEVDDVTNGTGEVSGVDGGRDLAMDEGGDKAVDAEGESWEGGDHGVRGEAAWGHWPGSREGDISLGTRHARVQRPHRPAREPWR